VKTRDCLIGIGLDLDLDSTVESLESFEPANQPNKQQKEEKTTRPKKFSAVTEEFSASDGRGQAKVSFWT